MVLEKVLKTTKYVVDNSQKVKINEEKIPELAKRVVKEKVPALQRKYYFFGSPSETIQYFFILDSLNFCFFAEKNEKKWNIQSGKERPSGYFSLALALTRAVSQFPLLNADFLANISLKDVKGIFKGSGEIPLLEKRWQILRETGKILLEKFDGQAINIVKNAQQNAQRLVEILLECFPSFRDITNFNGKEVYFLKRAQIFASSLWGAFEGKDYGYFEDISELTCFADYKIAQILSSFGVLEYSSQLLQKIKEQELIPASSQEEAEIRANTIWAIEKIKQELKKQGINLPSFKIDWILWVLSKGLDMQYPHHQTRTIYY